MDILKGKLLNNAALGKKRNKKYVKTRYSGVYCANNIAMIFCLFFL